MASTTMQPKQEAMTFVERVLVEGCRSRGPSYLRQLAERVVFIAGSGAGTGAVALEATG